MRSLRPVVFALVAAAVLLAEGPSVALAQGRTEYFNVESPQVEPIAVIVLDGKRFILAANTPNNTLEILSTDETLPPAARILKTVRVGLEPVSVAFNPVNRRAYTANFLGDSISVVALGTNGSGVTATLVMTKFVGDEPMDIAFSNDGQSLFVTHNTLGTFGWRNATTLDPVAPIPPITDMSQIDLVASGPFSPIAIKEPRTAVVDANRLFVLGFKGGSDPAVYDFDVYVRDLSSQMVSTIAGLGSTNFNMAFAANGDLWVVGGEAQNAGNVTEPEVAAEPTGFVKSTLYLLPASGSSFGPPVRRDLNDVDGNETPVGLGRALAQPTGVAVFEPPAGAKKVFVAAFGSDRVAAITPSPLSSPYGWPLTPIVIKTAPSSTNPAAGPRALAVKYADSGDPADPGHRVYVMNRLDNSIAIVDPVSESFVESIPLSNDPTPDYVRAGRVFLYGAKFSGNGFVSCASCHMDGRTDSLLWRLGTPAVPPAPFPQGFADGVAPQVTFLADKGPMITQSLQGLVNTEVEPSIQGYFTNAPYHWRGDRADFTEFNGAFVGLLGGADVGGGNGLEPAEMIAFRTFIDSIHYPPNPYQLETRVFSGTLGDPDDEATGSGALRGLKLFHTHPLAICSGRSCIQCHWLPEGSNNRGTVKGVQVIESAAMRGLVQREARLDKAAGAPSNVVTAEFGLIHDGVVPSLNAFINRFNLDFQSVSGGLLAVKEFARQFDFTVAPIVGRPQTVDRDNKGAPATTAALDLFESQASVANSGVAVHSRIAGQEKGYFFDLTASPAAYRLEGSSPPVWIDRAALLAQVTGLRDRLVFIATPLGSERRAASVGGTSTPVAGFAPSGLELRPAVTNTAFADIPSLTKNWDPNDPVPGHGFSWANSNVDSPPSVKSIRFLQHGLIVDGGGLYGVTALRHEAPRRLAVAGFGIEPGAVLKLHVPNSATPPNPLGPLGQIRTIEFALPVHPTASTLPDGRRVWQTAAEIDPLVLYTFMLGGPLARGVPATLDPLTVVGALEPPAAGTYDPHGSNWHYVIVENPGPVPGDGGWQRLLVE